MNKQFTPAQEVAVQLAYIAYIKAAAAVAMKRENEQRPIVRPVAPVTK
jgi:hypothetical protein